MGAEPKVSVSAIVPTYNRGAFIVRSIESILGQTLPPSEIIVVDDGSTDGTAEDLRSRYGDRLTIIQQANEGVSSARRKGLEAASGDWIAFLDSDDEWLPRHLEILANAASVADERVSLVFGDTVVVRDSGDGSTLFEEEGFSTSGPIQVFSEAFATQFPYMFTLLQSSLIRRTAMLETGAFLERLRSSEDFLVSFRLSLHSSFAAVPDRVTRIYRTSDLDASSLDRDKSQHEDYYRARMIAFGEAAALLGDRSWRVLYLRAASCLTRLRIKQGADAVPVALQQFLFGVTPRAVAWTIAAFARSIVAPPRPRSC
ncbi:MAG: glycosyltransferase family 2 protein [Caulobacteraceae bacterium]